MKVSATRLADDRAFQLYESRLNQLVDEFTEADAAQWASLVTELKRNGQTMKCFDAAIAASVLARGDKLLTLDCDFDRFAGRLTLLKP